MGRRFWSDTRGSILENLCIAVAVLTIASVAAVQGLDQASTAGPLGRFVARLGGYPAASAIDFTPTGSIGVPREMHLDPCTGQVK